MKAAIENNRVIKVRGLHNLRELGGLTTADGKTIRRGLLYRSAAMDKLSEKGLLWMQSNLGLSRVIDLRTDEETVRRPDVRTDGIEYVHVPIFSERTVGISRETKMSNSEILNSLPSMPELYRRVVTEEDCRRNLANALRAVMNYRGGAVLWHCTAGKDRCGILTTLVLASLDVKAEDIISDYLLTNDDPGERGYGYYLAVILSGKGTRRARQILDMFRAKRDYLEAAQRALTEEFSCGEDFLINGLGIKRREIEEFRDYVLE